MQNSQSASRQRPLVGPGWLREALDPLDSHNPLPTSPAPIGRLIVSAKYPCTRESPTPPAKPSGPTADDYKEPSETPQSPNAEPQAAPNRTWPKHEDIAGKAYFLYLDQDSVHGHDVEHWLRAESELEKVNCDRIVSGVNVI